MIFDFIYTPKRTVATVVASIEQNILDLDIVNKEATENVDRINSQIQALEGERLVSYGEAQRAGRIKAKLLALIA